MPALFALASAATFGLAAPLAKRLLEALPPVLLAGLLYLGAGLFLTAVRPLMPTRAARRSLDRRERVVLAGAVVTGGVAAPPLLLWGLARTPASAASLLLNLEVVLTTLLAGLVFGERVGRRVVGASLLVAAGGVVLGWPGGGVGVPLASLGIAAACLLWALDNNLTRLIADADAVRIAQVKGLAAGAVNVALALALGSPVPGARSVALAFALGVVSYGVSLVLFILAMRDLGAARAGGYFAVAPFFGAVLGLVLLHEPATPLLVAGGVFMAAGAWLLLGERHAHRHRHEAGVHTHRHVHDDHHQHAHEGWEGPEPHTHPHPTGPIEHEHAHVHDAHHGHGHA